MSKLDFKFSDGGRSKYYEKTNVSDCGVRAIAIALDRDYDEVYKEAMSFLGYSPRNGILIKDCKKLFTHFGFKWHACMKIGTGCKVHLAKGEVPMNKTIVCSVSKHLVCVKNGVIYDRFDPSRDGTRCVYGYYYL